MYVVVIWVIAVIYVFFHVLFAQYKLRGWGCTGHAFHGSALVCTCMCQIVYVSRDPKYLREQLEIPQQLFVQLFLVQHLLICGNDAVCRE